MSFPTSIRKRQAAPVAGAADLSPWLLGFSFWERILHDLHQQLNPTGLRKKRHQIWQGVIIAVKIKGVTRDTGLATVPFNAVGCTPRLHDANVGFCFEIKTIPYKGLNEERMGVFFFIRDHEDLLYVLFLPAHPFQGDAAGSITPGTDPSKGFFPVGEFMSFYLNGISRRVKGIDKEIGSA
jgi:hypothetical protein